MSFLRDFFARNEVDSGETTLPRHLVNSGGVVTSNGSMRLTYFTAKKTETVNTVRTLSGSTAGVGATLCRTGIYSVASNGDLTLIASTANDTNLWIAQNTAYDRALSASFAKARGVRYAIGNLVVGSSTAPTMIGMSTIVASEAAVSPRICGFVAGQTDLPSSVSAGSITNTNVMHYVALLP